MKAAAPLFWLSLRGRIPYFAGLTGGSLHWLQRRFLSARFEIGPASDQRTADVRPRGHRTRRVAAVRLRRAATRRQSAWSTVATCLAVGAWTSRPEGAEPTTWIYGSNPGCGSPPTNSCFRAIERFLKRETSPLSGPVRLWDALRSFSQDPVESRAPHFRRSGASQPGLRLPSRTRPAFCPIPKRRGFGCATLGVQLVARPGRGV